MGYKVPDVNNCYDFTCVLGQLNQWCCVHAPLVQAVYDQCKATSLSEQVSWLFGVVRDVVKAQQCVDGNFETLYNFVKDYVDNIDIQKYVDDWLNKKLEDGTLENLLNSEILNNILKETGTIIHDYPFMWRDDEYKNYVDMVLSVAASYFVNEINNECIVGEPTGRNTPFFAKYNDGNTYMGLLGQGEFIYTDKEVYNGNTYPVLYLDCSGFVSLMTKGRRYTDSPYYKAFTGTTDEYTLRSYAREIGTYYTDEYTIDFLNKIVSYWIADMLHVSGCPLHNLSKYDSKTKELNVDMSEFAYLKTGDILFNGSSYLTNRYKGIHHCMIYLKSLDDIQIYGQPYGVSFKAVLHDNDNEQYGYIIHCDSESGVLKIETLYSRMIKYGGVNPGTEYIYYSHPVHNAWNSSKANYKITGLLQWYSDTSIIGRSGGSYVNGFSVYNPTFDATSKIMTIRKLYTTFLQIGHGNALKIDDDLNNLTNGVYFSDTADISAGILNTPFTAFPYLLIDFGNIDNDNPRYGIQIAFPQSGESNQTEIKIRTRGFNTPWNQWKSISLT